MKALTPMKESIFYERLILASSYAFNGALWLTNIGLFLKILLTLVTVATTIMAFLNQYKTFTKNFKTLWVVVFITKYITRQKPRRRGIRITKKVLQQKPPTDD